MADTFLHSLKSPQVLKAIAEADQPGVSSAEVQAALLAPATLLNFASERRGLFSGYPISALRPDYYCPVGDSGILLEVERG